MRTRSTRVAAVAGALTIVLAACGDDATDSPTAEPAADESSNETSEQMSEEMSEPGTIVDVAVENGSFETLVAAVQAAGLVDTLSGEGPFTIFAPTDDAFATALDTLGITAEDLLADTDTLTSILTYHVVAGEVPAAEVVTLDGQSVATVNGAEAAISIVGEDVMVNDSTVLTVDVGASNGIIHVIDTVLVPPLG
jgi:uncharacterized surface protein with fasciclin (FAS1) repeats